MPHYTPSERVRRAIDDDAVRCGDLPGHWQLLLTEGFAHQLRGPADSGWLHIGRLDFTLLKMEYLFQ
jgi:hypothetical protein